MTGDSFRIDRQTPQFVECNHILQGEVDSGIREVREIQKAFRQGVSQRDVFDLQVGHVEQVAGLWSHHETAV